MSEVFFIGKVRIAQIFSGSGRGIFTYLEALNMGTCMSWIADSIAWKCVPFWDGSWVERIFVIIYVRSYICFR